MESYGLWAAVLIYGLLMFVLSPQVRDFGGFFLGKDQRGTEVKTGLLIGSVVITWLFAKSITNAANLGAAYGFVGAVAYAGWYFSIPIGGAIIYFLRTRLEVSSLAEFITNKYGRAALLGFTVVIMVRLFNEIWSNTAVVGAYFGEAGSTPYYMSALLFAAMTLGYSLRGGLRSSIVTDAVQFGLGLCLLGIVLALILPRAGAASLVDTGEWTLAGGVDLLFVAMIQSLSYAFHDPVLTDRAFLNRPAKMLQGYLLAGAVAAVFIILFGLVGVYAQVEGIDVGQDAPLKVAQTFGIFATIVMSVLMMVSAGSTLDSTLSSFSKVVVTDLGGLTERGRSHIFTQRFSNWIERVGPLKVGRYTMVLTVILGSLPLFAGTEILKATTISGTMVLGLAPIFIFFFWAPAGKWAFHLALWPGLVMGLWFAFGTVPDLLHIGDGPNAALLGLNLWGSLVIFALFGLGAAIDMGLNLKKTSALAITLVGLFASPALKAANEPQSEQESVQTRPSVRFSGQTMFRLTTQMADWSSPSAEVYNVRLVGELEWEPFTFVIEPRLRQTQLRSFSPSNIWLQQAYGAFDIPTKGGGIRLSGGLLYNQLGLFWDDSWFGNLPYLNGHKLNPDMNLEAATDHRFKRWGLRSWVQLSPGEDGLNGTYTTPQKAARLILPADLETASAFDARGALRGRVAPSLYVGLWTLTPGASIQHSFYTGPDEAERHALGSQTLWGADLTVGIKSTSFAAEYLDEVVRGFSNSPLERHYFLGRLISRVFERDALWFSSVDIGASGQITRYEPEGFKEWMITARVNARVHKMVGVTVEYVRAQLFDEATPELDRIEWILHIFY